ncbi:unnamed protein product [Calypogeia fissa]
MEMQGVVVSRLSESKVAGALLTGDLPLDKCTGVLEVGVGSCFYEPVSSRALVNYTGGFQAISSGQSSRSNANCKLESSNSKRDQSRRPRQQQALGGERSEASRIFSLSLFGISCGTAFLGIANDAGATVAKKKSASLTLAAFAVTKVAYEKITKLFAQKWLEETGQEVRIRLSIAGSGSQARAVMDGLPADIVSLALPLDVIKIQEAGLIDDDWQQRLPNNGVPAETTVCLVTRPGNPKEIIDWADLSRSDVSVLTANPKTAGVARWNFLALWGSVTVTGGGEEDAQQFVEDVFRNVPVEPRDAREVSDVFFKQEIGDVMITYENEIYLTNEKIVESKGEPLPFTLPEVNVRVETALAVVDKNARRNGVHEIATAFAEFCFTEPAQREYAKAGFRPSLDSVAAEFGFPPIGKPWRVEEEIGDWLLIQKKFFADKAIVDVIEENIRETRLTL